MQLGDVSVRECYGGKQVTNDVDAPLPGQHTVMSLLSKWFGVIQHHIRCPFECPEVRLKPDFLLTCLYGPGTGGRTANYCRPMTRGS